MILSTDSTAVTQLSLHSIDKDSPSIRFDRVYSIEPLPPSELKLTNVAEFNIRVGGISLLGIDSSLGVDSSDGLITN